MTLLGWSVYVLGTAARSLPQDHLQQWSPSSMPDRLQTRSLLRQHSEMSGTQQLKTSQTLREGNI